jgi:hypothetical protein
LLQGYVDSVLFRDVVERFGVSQIAALRWLTRQCLRNPARGFSVHRLHQDLKSQGHGVGKDALHAMLGHLLDSFLLGSVALATDSERQRNSNPRKLYPADPGLIRAFDASGRSNLGQALETAVQNELERRGAEIGYVRTTNGLEVDFLSYRAGAEAELIQVCADLSAPDTRTRELRALASAAQQYPRAKPRLLVMGPRRPRARGCAGGRRAAHLRVAALGSRRLVTAVVGRALDAVPTLPAACCVLIAACCPLLNPLRRGT